jgi:hypothetical protein
MDDARKGIVRPANPNATLTPEQHNLGGYSGRSQFTSWSREKMVAVEFAESNGPGGLLLRAEISPSSGRHTWEWIESLDGSSESEVLMLGFRMDAEVVAL